MNGNFFLKINLNGLAMILITIKKINIVEADGFLAQAKELGKALSTVNIENNKTAIVLGDEKLIHPFLNSIPENISQEH